MASQFDKQVLFIFSAVLIVALAGSIWTINSTNVGYFVLTDACPLGTNPDSTCVNQLMCDNSANPDSNIVYHYDTSEVSMQFLNPEGIDYRLSADDLKQDSQTLVSIEGPHILQNQKFVITNDYTTRILVYKSFDSNTNKATFIDRSDTLTNLTANVTPFTGIDASTGYYGAGSLSLANGQLILNFVLNGLLQLDGDLNQNGKFHEIIEIPIRLLDGSTQYLSAVRDGCGDYTNEPNASPVISSQCYTRITNITLNPANPNPAQTLHITPDDKVELAFQISTPVIDSAKFYESAFKYTVVDPDGLQVNAPDYPDGMAENNYDYQGQIGYDAGSNSKWVGVYLGHMRSDNSLGHMKQGNYTITLFGFPFRSDIDPNGYYTSGCDGVTNETNYDSWKIVVDIFDKLPNPPILDITPIATPFEVTHATTSVPYPTTPATPPITGCTDTDGNNQYTAGTVTLDNGNNGVDTCLSITPPTLSSPVTVTGVDSCSGPNCYVDEKICVVGGNGIADVGGQHIQCSGGCNAGVCATSTTPTGPTGIIISSITSVGQNIADGVLEHGLDFKFVVTLPTGENQLTARFNDWKVNGAPAFATFNNTFISYKGVQYKVDSQSDYGLSDTVAVTDEDANAAGIQTIFDVMARIPVNTTAGNFTSSFRLRSLPAGGA